MMMLRFYTHPLRAAITLNACLLTLSFFASDLASLAYADLYTIEKDGVITITTERIKGGRLIAGERKPARKNKVRRKGKVKRRSYKSSGKNKRSPKKKNMRASKKKLSKRALRFKEYVIGAAEYYDLPEALIWGVMEVESGFNPKAKSNKGALGLMQLMPFTAEDMGVKTAFNPEQNIYGGARLLRILANRFNGDLVLTLSAYHAGGGAVSAKRGIPYERTAQYVRSTLNAYYSYMDNPPYSSQ
jgi:soluble lytic murein transglycosylase-like protein